MLVVIGSDGDTLESKVAKRFGHANYFVRYDTNTKSLESFKNLTEGHNHENLQEFLDMGVEAFIVGNIGPHAFQIINTPKSYVFLARKMSLSEAIEKLQQNSLEHLTEPTVKHSINQRHEH